ncbi:MAG: low specificity L-threonine aldolase [Weeksellaceae bacterium]|jgi:threonine aldolase|nr:low specificity L-threonine aldolase [Weeksellaceae bacterium]
MKSFASDNYSGVHPKIMEAILAANSTHQISYGDDEITEQTNKLFREKFGNVEVLYVFNGTGANVVSLKCALLPFQSIICTDSAHILVDECGAPTQSIGSSIISIPSQNGKLTPEMILPHLATIGNVHHTQPKVISISQSTELGTIYTVEELKSLSKFAHLHNLYLHVDGARLSNAVSSLGCTLKEATADCDIDIMSFGGTKNGLMMGEAILIFNEELKKNAPFFHKQSAQLYSKNRFLSAQFKALLEDDLWFQLASHANSMAKKLAEMSSQIEEVKITQKVEANGVFVTIPPYAVEPLRAIYPFYNWNETTNELRWMCSFDTTEEEVFSFVDKLKELIHSYKNNH